MPLAAEDGQWLSDQGVRYTEHLDPTHGPLLVFRDFVLPQVKFTVATADILSKMPTNFPDSGPDMFWAKPRVLLAPDGRFAICTDVNEMFLGETWQRWSRYWNALPWQSGIYGIDTVSGTCLIGATCTC
jgi:hypothetical protein